MDFTERLGLNKPDPDPVTGDVVDITKLNDNADRIDETISFTLCTNATRPTTPFPGQAILETDTGRAYVWGGSAWLPILIGSAAGGRFDSRIGLGISPSSLVNRMLRIFSGATGSGSQVRLETSGTPTGNRALSTFANGTGDTDDRWWADFDGKLHWGPGNSPNHDVSVRRSAAGVLDVEGSLTVNGKQPGDSVQQVFTASGNWAKPAGAKRVWVRMVGGGGAGGGAEQAVAGEHSKGAGGGGGEYAEKWFNAADLPLANYAVTVGAGGVGVVQANGGNGGTSGFGGIFTAAGGMGGTWTAENPAGWGATGGDGGTGGTGTADFRSGGQGGALAYGTAALCAGGAGGGSVLGGGGRSVSSGATISSNIGDDATGYGGGGGGAAVNTTGAAARGGHGKAGVVIVTTFF